MTDVHVEEMARRAKAVTLLISAQESLLRVAMLAPMVGEDQVSTRAIALASECVDLRNRIRPKAKLPRDV
jgi:hypothetical protein